MRRRRADRYNTNFSDGAKYCCWHPFTSGTIGLTMDLHITGWRDAVGATADPEARDPFLIDAAGFRSETGYQLLDAEHCSSCCGRNRTTSGSSKG